jgi:histone chaperone ASF1
LTHLCLPKQVDPPDPFEIPDEDIIGVTVLLLTCSYQGQEFIRVGYYVNNDYADEQLREEPPQVVQLDKIQRNILADKPRVTKFPIAFHSTPDEQSVLSQLGSLPPNAGLLPSDASLLSADNSLSASDLMMDEVLLEGIAT